MTIYNSFIISNFNYCLLAWHFCRMSSSNKMEKVQDRALPFINNDFTSSLQDLLSSTNTVPLHVRRMKQMATEVFKIVNDMSPEYTKDLITIQKYSSEFRENRCPPPPKPVYGGNFSHEAVTLKIRSRSPKSNKLLILSDLYRLANLVTFHPMVHEITGRRTLFGLILVDYAWQ